MTKLTDQRTGFFEALKRLSTINNNNKNEIEEFFCSVTHHIGDDTPPPAFIVTESGESHVYWQSDNKIVDVDIKSDKCHWFYRDRITDEIDGTEETVPLYPISLNLLRRIKTVAEDML